MWRAGADVAKIATTATDISDARRMLALLDDRSGEGCCCRRCSCPLPLLPPLLLLSVQLLYPASRALSRHVIGSVTQLQLVAARGRVRAEGLYCSQETHNVQFGTLYDGERCLDRRRPDDRAVDGGARPAGAPAGAPVRRAPDLRRPQRCP